MICYTSIDDQLWNVKKALFSKVSVDEAGRIISPLSWYISTGRASIPFLKWFLSAKPFVVARLLMKGGSDDEIIARLKAKMESTLA